jgi:osmotically-inducible protein OsmY
MLRTLAAVAVGGLLATALPVAAGEDAPLAERVEARLRKAGLDREADIQVHADGATVLLSGTATTLAAQRAAVKAARKEAKAVLSQIAVVPLEARTDAQLRTAVTDAILRYPRFTIFDAVGFDVTDGVIVLKGSVQQPYRRSDVEARVADVAGVRGIRNEIAVQPVSTFDDRLRWQLARAIYGNDNFSRFAHWPNPPVRILVARGRVTLAGSVASPVDRALVGHIARGVLSFGVDNQVSVERDQKEPVGVSI